MPSSTPEKPAQGQEAHPAALVAITRTQEYLNPYRVIHEVQVPLRQKNEAMEWLSEHLGLPAMMAAPARMLMSDRHQHYYDASLLETTNYQWDGFFDPGHERLVFRIKDHDQEAMVFKLTFGGC
jgi:hypothetical protein